MAEAGKRLKLELDLALDTGQPARPPRRKDRSKSRRLRSGDLCPICQTEHLDYDGLLNLSCPRCGAIVSGCFT